MLYIFDKDGTLVESPAGRPPSRPTEQRLLPRVAEKLAELRAAGHKLAIASNQGGVAWGYISLSQAYRIVHHAADLVGGVDAVAVCPYDPRAAGRPGSRPRYARPSRRRKPAPGMILDLMRRLKVAPEETVYVGDQESDRRAAEAAGVHFAWAEDFFAPRPRVHYKYVGHICWECADHPAPFPADAGPADWEVVTIGFRRDDLENPALLCFLHRLAEALGITWLNYRPRKNPLRTEFGRFVLRQMAGEEEVRIRELTETDEDWDWPGSIRWLAVEDTSIFDDGCVTEACPSFDPAATANSPQQDIVIHAEAAIVDAFLGALYDWNRGASSEDAILWAVVAATKITKIRRKE